MIPNLFTKQRIPSKIPEILENKISDIFINSKDKERFLKNAFFYIVWNRWWNRYNLIYKFSRLFRKDILEITNSKWYLHCTTMNFLLRIMAVKSGLFKDEDIILKLTNSWYIFPHQYLKIRISDKKRINLDPWSYQFGINYGKYWSWFDSIKTSPIR